MDDVTINLLKSWDFDALIDHFKENCIDKESMSALTPELIKELIPQIGLRIKFNKKWQEHFNKIEDVIPERDENRILKERGGNRILKERDGNSDLHEHSSSDEDSNDEKATGSLIFRKLQRPSVKNILKKTSQGRAILKSYEKGKILNRKCRNVIVDLILSEVLNNIHVALKNEDFDSLSKEIETLFPTETCSTYYIPPIAKRYSRNNKSVTSRGKLVDKYRNKIRDYKKLTGYSLTNSSESASASTSTSMYNSEAEDDFIIRESILWLESNLSPWQLVENHWKITSSYRHNQIQTSADRNMTEIFTQWPILKHPTAYKLIDEDFKFLKLASEDCITNWFNFFSTIQEICSINKEEKNLCELRSLLETDDLTNDAKVVIQVLLLPHLISPKGRICIKKEHFKSSISECKNSIILHVKIHGDISHIQEEKIKRAQKFGLTVQPYIIVIGPTLAEVHAFYVCLDKVLYQVSTILEAVDICFKIFHVFDLHYPPESEHIWYTIQNCLYKFSTKCDKQISYIMPIINTFKMLVSTKDIVK